MLKQIFVDVMLLIHVGLTFGGFGVAAGYVRITFCQFDVADNLCWNDVL